MTVAHFDIEVPTLGLSVVSTTPRCADCSHTVPSIDAGVLGRRCLSGSSRQGGTGGESSAGGIESSKLSNIPNSVG